MAKFITPLEIVSGAISNGTGDIVTIDGSGTIKKRTASEIRSDIGALASSSYTASDILTKLKTVDGSGSGLDADLLDGQNGTYYASKSYVDTELAGKADSVHNHSAGDITSGTLSVSRGGTGLNTITSGNYLVGAGTSSVALKTPGQVLSDIGAASSSHTHAFTSLTDTPASYTGAGSKLVAVNSGGTALEFVTAPTSAVWGNITGTLSNQTDLNSALAGKANSSHTHAASDITSGTLAVSRGGTGASSLTSGSYLVGNGTSAVTLKSPGSVRTDIGAAADSDVVKLSGAQSIAGVKTFTDSLAVSDPSKITLPGAPYQFNAGSSTILASTPAPLIAWHDMFRWSTPTYETSSDEGSTWSSDTLPGSLFSGIQNQAVSLGDAARFTWSSGMQYNYADWLLIAFTYNSQPPTVSVLLEGYNASTSSWDTLYSGSGTYNTVQQLFRNTRVANHTSIRLTLISTVAGKDPIKVAAIQLYTSRWGDQGQGKEREYPYSWDKDKNITLGGSLKITTVSSGTGDIVTVDGSGNIKKRTTAEIRSDIGAAASSHTHTISDVSGLQAALDGKAASSHTHSASDITSGTLSDARIPGLAASKITSGTFDIARIPTGTTSSTVALGNHNHSLDSLSNVTITSNTSGELLKWNGSAWVNNTLSEAGVAAASHTHAISDVSGLQAALDGKASTSHTHSASDITSGTFADARIPSLAASKVTSGTFDIARIPTGTTSSTVALGNHNHSLDSLSNVTITSNSAGEILKWSGSAWINNTLSEAGIAAASHTHSASDITSGTLADARIPSLNASKITAGTFDIARIPTGTTSSTVSLGNHNHSLDSLSNVTITSNTSGEILKWNGTDWVNNTLAEAGVAAASHTHKVADVNSESATNGYVIAANGSGGASWVAPTSGPQGDPGVVISATAPLDTDVLWLDTSVAGIASLPAGGSTGQTLVKNSGSDFDVKWDTAASGLPSGGTTGQALVKKSGTNYDTEWATLDVTPSGQSGGTNGRVVRISSANTWTDASQADTATQLTGLMFKQGDKYYGSGSVVTGLSGLTTGSVYYLSTSGNITTTAPTPSSSVIQVAVGKAISTTALLFQPGVLILGE